MLTREEKVAVVLVTLGCLLGLATGYQPRRWWLLEILFDLVVVLLLVLFAAGVQFRMAPGPWRPRMLLMLFGIIALPLSFLAGVIVNELDFKYRRKHEYAAWIARIEIPPEVTAGDEFWVPVPAEFDPDGRVLALRQSDGHLRVQFRSGRRRFWYVFCEQRCEPEALLRDFRGYQALDEHWVIAYR